jgi:hypothetical protein
MTLSLCGSLECHKVDKDMHVILNPLGFGSDDSFSWFKRKREHMYTSWEMISKSDRVRRRFPHNYCTSYECHGRCRKVRIVFLII